MSSIANYEETKQRLQKALEGSFRVIELIGHGGMGQVYLAEHKLLGGKWAFKVLNQDLAGDPSLVDRFLTEARIEAQLHHPNIVQVVDVSQPELNQHDALYYLRMQYIEGEDLDARIRRMGRLGVAETIDIALQITKALEYAHEYDKGIIHRDLKPSNIRIDKYGTAYVLDFGIAKVRDISLLRTTQTGEMLGTTLYMSPEQEAGRSADIRSDLYALGVIMYEMLIGDNPFEHPDGREIRNRIRNYQPPPVISIRNDVPPRLSEIIDQQMSKDPAFRRQRARKLKEDLAALQSGARPLTPIPLPAQRSRIRQVRPTPVEPGQHPFTPAAIPETPVSSQFEQPRALRTPAVAATPISIPAPERPAPRAINTPIAPTPVENYPPSRRTPALSPVPLQPTPVSELVHPPEAASLWQVAPSTPAAMASQIPEILPEPAAPLPIRRQRGRIRPIQSTPASTPAGILETPRPLPVEPLYVPPTPLPRATPISIQNPECQMPAAATPAESFAPPKQTPVFSPVPFTPAPVFESVPPPEAAAPLQVASLTPATAVRQTPEPAASTPVGESFAGQMEYASGFAPAPPASAPLLPDPAATPQPQASVNWPHESAVQPDYSPPPAPPRMPGRLSRQVMPSAPAPISEPVHPPEAAAPLQVASLTPAAAVRQTPEPAASTPVGESFARQMEYASGFTPAPPASAPLLPDPAATPQPQASVNWPHESAAHPDYSPPPAAPRMPGRLSRQVMPSAPAPVQEMPFQEAPVAAGYPAGGSAHLPYSAPQYAPEPLIEPAPREAGRKKLQKHKTATHTHRMRISISPTARPVFFIIILSAVATAIVLLLALWSASGK